MIRILSVILTLVMGWENTVLATDYYVDSKLGSDGYSGKAAHKAWASLNKVNKKTFKPGDKLLFKVGTKYHGQLAIKGSGTAKKPIIVSSYGEGAKPQIHGKGQKEYTLLLANVEYIEVSNLDITNMGKTRKAKRRGVIVSAENSGDLHHIVLKNLTIHHVNGSLKKKEGGGGAIQVRTKSNKVKSRYIDFQILDNHIYKTSRNGIGFGGNFLRSNWHPHLKVIIKGNLMEQVPGDGIVVVGSDGALVEGNLLRDFPDILPRGDAAAGIWPWSSDNTVIQFNEVSGHKAKWDGQGFDADFNSIGTIIQNNYSHDNYGGFLLICNNGTKYGGDRNIGTVRTIIRNNVSINDGIRPYPTHAGVFSPTFHLTGPIEDTHIYGNVIIIPKKGEDMDKTVLKMDNWGGPWPMKTLFEKNEIYFEDGIKVDLAKVTDIKLRGNKLSKPTVNMDGTNTVIAPEVSFDLQKLKQDALQRKINKPKN